MIRSTKPAVLLILAASLVCIIGCNSKSGRDFYHLKIYNIESESQEKRMDQYLEKAFLPALHRLGIYHAGVFKPIEGDANRDKIILVWIPLKSLEEFEKLPAMLSSDEEYLEASRNIIKLLHRGLDKYK